MPALSYVFLALAGDQSPNVVPFAARDRLQAKFVEFGEKSRLFKSHSYLNCSYRYAYNSFIGMDTFPGNRAQRCRLHRGSPALLGQYRDIDK